MSEIRNYFGGEDQMQKKQKSRMNKTRADFY